MQQRMGVAACWLLLAAATQAAQDPPSREQACPLSVNNYLGAGGAEQLEKDGRPCSQACAAGYAEDCYSLGVLHRIVDSSAAIGFLHQACDLGHAAGCQDLGAAYRFGSGVPRDDARGIRLYERACRLAQVTACTDLGMLYADGEVVARDHALAGSWYRQAAQLRQAACARGSLPDCSCQADMPLNGQGGPSDLAQAAALYHKACTGGYPHACYERNPTTVKQLAPRHRPARVVLLDRSSATGRRR